MTTPNPNDPAKGLTPDGLVNQLFDVAFNQNPREAAVQVIDFLGASLFYSLTSAKKDVVVYLTETLIHVVLASTPDEASRKELLKKVSDTIANALPASSPAANQPAASQPVAGKPVAGKPVAGKP